MSRLSGYGDDASAAAPPGAAGSAAASPPDREAAATNAREIELFKRAQSGDRGAFAQIVTLYQDRLFNALLRMVGEHDDALELAQETFTKALEKIDSFRSEAKPYTWLFRIGMNLAISELRKTRRRRTFTLSGGGGNGRVEDSEDQAAGLMERVAQDRGMDPAQAVEKREQHDQVLAALGRVDAEHRAILIMRDVEGFDYQQMADVLGLPLGTLKSRLFRARVALRDELREYMEDKK